MRPRDLVNVLNAAYNARQPTLIWGGPGIGKSSIVHQLANKRGIGFIDRRISQMEPVDLRGLPMPDKETMLTTWFQSEDLPIESRDGKEGILFLDEVNHAPKSMRAACFQLILDRRVGKYKLPDGWVVFSAANRAKDRAITEQLETPLKNRFMHLVLEVNNDDWLVWALQNDISPQVISFIRQFPTLLNEFEELVNGPAEKRKHLDDLNAFATPRSWEFVDRMYKQNLENNQLETFQGIVGESAGLKFTAHLTLCDKLPSLDLCIAEPEKTPVPTDPGIMYALASGLAAKITKANIEKALTYVGRIKDAEYQVLTVKDAIMRKPELMDTEAFTKWASKNRHVLL